MNIYTLIVVLVCAGVLAIVLAHADKYLSNKYANYNFKKHGVKYKSAVTDQDSIEKLRADVTLIQRSMKAHLPVVRGELGEACDNNMPVWPFEGSKYPLVDYVAPRTYSDLSPDELEAERAEWREESRLATANIPPPKLNSMPRMPGDPAPEPPKNPPSDPYVKHPPRPALPAEEAAKAKPKDKD